MILKTLVFSILMGITTIGCIVTLMSAIAAFKMTRDQCKKFSVDYWFGITIENAINLGLNCRSVCLACAIALVFFMAFVDNNVWHTAVKANANVHTAAKCVCKCKECKAVSKRVDAMMKCLNIDDSYVMKVLDDAAAESKEN